MGSDNAPSPDSPSSQSPAKSPPSPPPQNSSSPPQDSPPSPPPPSSSNSPSPKSSPSPSSSPPPPPPSSNNDQSPPPPKSGSSHSPPPPHHSSSSNGTKSPPPPSKHSSSSQTRHSPPSSDSSDVNVGVYVGIGVGVGLFILALIIVCVSCGKKKKRRREDEMHYYSAYQGGNQYYNSSQQPNWHNGPQNADHVVKLSPHGPPGGGGWGAPQPPPPMMSSGEMSSNYSGPRPTPLPPPSPAMALGFNQSTFTYDELAAATGGFAEANVLGQGGFGYVHKGVLPNGKEIAVKSLKSGSGQGEREFQAEVEIISRVHHRHLVSLVGYCIAGGQRMLVYEFVPNNTMEYHLHGKGLPTMDWPTRLRIALGSAKGLAYLHEDCHPRIIHRDIKAANILLDFNFEAMVADFGLAKLSSDNYTHVSTRVMGTFGYLAPEYASSGKLTEKSDVFSYGIMLLELITGKRPVDNMNMEDSLVDWARPLLSRAMDEGNYNELVDLRLEMNYDPQELSRMIACAAASIRHSARKRPRMSQIVRTLEGAASLEALNEGVRPGQSSIYSSTSGNSEYDTTAYNADMKKFRQIALNSEEFTSSEHGATSSGGDSREIGKPPF